MKAYNPCPTRGLHGLHLTLRWIREVDLMFWG